MTSDAPILTFDFLLYTFDFLLSSPVFLPGLSRSHKLKLSPRTSGLSDFPTPKNSDSPDSHPTTQVSLLPPPCEEFTTNDPSLKATLVNPPGTISIPEGPHRAYGLKSTCRG